MPRHARAVPPSSSCLPMRKPCLQPIGFQRVLCRRLQPIGFIPSSNYARLISPYATVQGRVHSSLIAAHTVKQTVFSCRWEWCCCLSGHHLADLLELDSILSVADAKQRAFNDISGGPSACCSTMAACCSASAAPLARPPRTLLPTPQMTSPSCRYLIARHPSRTRCAQHPSRLRHGRLAGYLCPRVHVQDPIF